MCSCSSITYGRLLQLASAPLGSLGVSLAKPALCIVQARPSYATFGIGALAPKLRQPPQEAPPDRQA